MKLFLRYFVSVLLFLKLSNCQQEEYVSIFPPDMWHHHVHNPYYTYYNGNPHNGGHVVDHRNERKEVLFPPAPELVPPSLSPSKLKLNDISPPPVPPVFAPKPNGSASLLFDCPSSPPPQFRKSKAPPDPFVDTSSPPPKLKSNYLRLISRTSGADGLISTFSCGAGDGGITTSGCSSVSIGGFAATGAGFVATEYDFVTTGAGFAVIGAGFVTTGVGFATTGAGFATTGATFDTAGVGFGTTTGVGVVSTGTGGISVLPSREFSL
ncbi:hypothetical protein GCK72_000888 [Caenorhabditis remanei]|uniref:Uncharacterized protein n=1 Tax=Caenorhabditis remanei TaxID=31234 RepID=A0A6A5HN98_CAERE|nr:hypothetical protein GCK72_000888 [Caenorhabditis remanei]KAF1769075.1 hypothetical protein GCK72_000888 [Caenorhabditis remanei]